MTAKARVEYDIFNDGVKVFVKAGDLLLSFPPVEYHQASEGDGSSTLVGPLMLHEDEARAVYEALASYFGGLGADMTALRKDYDAERRRVDKFIDLVIRTAGDV